MTNSATIRTRRMAGLSILTALIIVLQVVATFVKVGPFSFTLALAPIVIGGALYGRKAGAWLGGVFSVVVLLMCITGGDAGGSILWNVSPLLCAVLCLVKGTAAGWVSAAVYRSIAAKNSFGAVICAAVVTPVVNTGIFLVGLVLFFQPTLAAWAGDAGMNITSYILFGLTVVNFLVELTLNLVLSGVIERIITYRVKALA